MSALLSRWTQRRHTIFRGTSVSRPLNPEALGLMAAASALLLSNALEDGIFGLPFWAICALAVIGRFFRPSTRPGAMDTFLNAAAVLNLAMGAILIVVRPSMATSDLVPAVIGMLFVLELRKAARGQDLMGFVPPMLFLITRQMMVSETLQSTLVNVIVVMAMLTALSLASETRRSRGWPFHLLRVIKVLVATIPVVLVFFALFPRLPFGDDSQAAPLSKPTFGLSRSMRPGHLSDLAQDAGAATAFTAEFEGGAALPAQLYWRALVMDQFDGLSWYETASTTPRLSATPDVRLRQAAPSRQRVKQLTIDLPNGMLPYVPVLDVAPAQSVRWSIEDGTSGYLLPDPVGVYRYLDGLHSSLRANVELSAEQAQTSTAEGLAEATGDRSDRTVPVSLRLPAKATSARVATLAQTMRQSSGATNEDPMPLVRAFSEMVYKGPYKYTLRPLSYGQSAVDELLLGARAGYCEHYASAFTVFMRLAGIPARVVTGYQGGEVDGQARQIRVASRSAHAWSEVWIPSKGWQRVDPTSFINPVNVDPEAAEFFRGTASELVGWRKVSQDMIDWAAGANVGWNRWVLGFDASSQDTLFEKIGAPPAMRSLIAMGAILGAIFAALGVATAVRLWKDRQLVSPQERQLKRLVERLRALGLVLEDNASPQQIKDALEGSQVPRRVQNGAAGTREALSAYEVWRYGPLRAGPNDVSRLLRQARRQLSQGLS